MMKRRKLMDFLLTNGFEDGTVNSKKVTWKICSTYPLHEAAARVVSPPQSVSIPMSSILHVLCSNGGRARGPVLLLN